MPSTTAKVLIAEQYDKSGWQILRIYLERDFDQAEKDKSMLMTLSYKDIHLKDIEIYGVKSKEEEIKEILDKTNNYRPSL